MVANPARAFTRCKVIVETNSDDPVNLTPPSQPKRPRIRAPSKRRGEETATVGPPP